MRNARFCVRRECSNVVDLSAGANVVIIGGGKMGEGILGGWLLAEQGPAACLDSSSFCVVEPDEQRRVYLMQRYGISCVADVADVAGVFGDRKADIVVLAVKPQVMMSVLREVVACAAFADDESRPLFISIAAGLTTARIEEALPAGARLVRVMPNMPLLVGAGATSVTSGAHALAEDALLVRDLFASLGVAVIVAEADMDATCALNGSGPAYVAAMIESLRDAGVAEGLEANVAEELALQTVLGTALLIRESGQSPAQVRESICSPGGTTLAALEAMDSAGFDAVFRAGVAAAVRRSKELASC